VAVKQRLRVDPIACKAHGMCAELFPERIRLDDWGYPIIDPRGVPDDLLEHARRAVTECPRTALHLVPVDDPAARRPEAADAP
jgi:ferredoxin